MDSFKFPGTAVNGLKSISSALVKCILFSVGLEYTTVNYLNDRSQQVAGQYHEKLVTADIYWHKIFLAFWWGSHSLNLSELFRHTHTHSHTPPTLFLLTWIYIFNNVPLPPPRKALAPILRKFLLVQEGTEFPKIYALRQTSRRQEQEGDNKQIPYRRAIKIMFRRKMCSRCSKFSKENGVFLVREVFQNHFVISYHIKLGFQSDPFLLVLLFLKINVCTNVSVLPI